MSLAVLPATAPAQAPSAASVRLLLLHQDAPRLLAALEALVAAGFAVTGAACPATSRLWLDAAGPPDAVLLPATLATPAYVRDLLDSFPRLHVIRLLTLPWPQPGPLRPREHALRLPFTAADLRRVLAEAGAIATH